MRRNRTVIILGLVVITLGVGFIYMGYIFFPLATEYTNLAMKFVESGTHQELVKFDLDMAQSNRMRGIVGITIGFILMALGAIIAMVVSRE